jgi:hypothetical protein
MLASQAHNENIQLPGKQEWNNMKAFGTKPKYFSIICF